MAKNTRKEAAKPAKPYPDFPLFPHATRRWAKKIRGRLVYFGPWDDPDGALGRYLQQRDDLYAGRQPRSESDGTTIRELCNRFLTAKQHLVDTGEIAPRTFADYHATCGRIVRVFGKERLVDDLRPDDFDQMRRDIFKGAGLVTLGNEIGRCRVVFNYAYQADLIDRPLKFGPMFKRPSKRVMRLDRQRKGIRLFEPAQLHQILAAAGSQLRGMIYLGINCGFGNADVARLPFAAVDLDQAWIDYPRPKTGIERRCPLWPETVSALHDVIATRPKPQSEDARHLVFVTKYGGSWHKTTRDNPIANEFRKLVDRVGIYRPGLTFYTLRHTFETIGGESRDQVAVDHILGHARDDMASVYRERISDERLVAVAEVVRGWLLEAAEKEGESSKCGR